MEKIAVINDLSGFGRCSLVAAISVISAMGVQPCPLPTSILSAQTGFSNYFLDDYTEKMDRFRIEWKKMGQSFRGIYTGFVSNTTQVEEIIKFINDFRGTETFLLVDPVMGDNGSKYDIFSPALQESMCLLAKQADIITPNLTELCLLTGCDYHALLPEHSGSLTAIKEQALSFLDNGPSHIVVTGIPTFSEEQERMIGNLYVTASSSSFYAFPYVGESFSGTGDLFASCLAAAMAKKTPLPEMIQTAGDFIVSSIRESVRNNVPRNEGVLYEQYLSMLIK